MSLEVAYYNRRRPGRCHPSFGKTMMVEEKSNNEDQYLVIEIAVFVTLCHQVLKDFMFYSGSSLRWLKNHLRWSSPGKWTSHTEVAPALSSSIAGVIIIITNIIIILWLRSQFSSTLSSPPLLPSSSKQPPNCNGHVHNDDHQWRSWSIWNFCAHRHGSQSDDKG